MMQKVSGLGSVVVLCLLVAQTTIFVVPESVTALPVVTQTSQTDFEGGSNWNVDISSNPGDATLAASPTSWIKMNDERPSIVANLPSPRFYSAAIWNGSHAFIFGGENGVPVNLDQIVKYDAVSKNVDVMSSILPFAGGQMSAVWDGDYAYLFGGVAQGGWNPRDYVLKFDPTEDQLFTMNARLPGPRYSTSAVWTESGAFIFGGTDNHEVYGDILEYDPVLDEISILPQRLPSPRYDTSAVFDGSDVYIFGGQHGALFIDEIVRFSPVGGYVSLMNARLPLGLAQTSAVFSGEYIYIFGGQGSIGAVDTVLRYDPSTDTLRTLYPRLPTERLATSAVWAGDKALLFGGFSPPLDEIVEYTPRLNPVMWEGERGSWFDYAVGDPCVIKDGSTYKMWFMGASEAAAWRWNIGYAESLDGVDWSVRPYPVLYPEPSNPWESYSVGHPFILKVGSLYRMWYSATAGQSEGENIGIAESPDGISWLRMATLPVMVPGNPDEWDGAGVTDPFIRYEAGTYRMWYGGYDKAELRYRVGYAESADGENWTKFPSNPVLEPGQTGSWDADGVTVSHVEKIDETYVIWYLALNPSGGAGVATSADGISWTKHQLNPVLTRGSGDSWDEMAILWISILRDSYALRMWYTGSDGGSWWRMRIGCASAAYGSSFVRAPSNPVMDLGPPGSWDSTYVAAWSVLTDSGEYKMWYSGMQGSVPRIGYATSADGIRWTKYPLNPILDVRPGTFDDEGVLGPFVIRDQGIYRMWYAGGRPGGNLDAKIGYAESADGINWTRPFAEPVLDGSGGGSWDDDEQSPPTVIFDDGVYKMWYGGWGVGGPWRIGLAVSPDGITWTKPDLGIVPGTNLINLPMGPEDHQNAPQVLKDSGTYRMWYGCRVGPWVLCYATSSDGVNWVKQPGNPVITPTQGSWDSYYTGPGPVLHLSDGYRIWYHGYDGAHFRVGHAYSQDGVTWMKRAVNPVLFTGNPGEWDSERFDYLTVIKVDEKYRMYYTGVSGASKGIGLAESLDGISWTKVGSGPVLATGSSGSWDDREVDVGTVLFDEGTYKMWYAGGRWGTGGVDAVGYATSVDGVGWIKYPANPIFAGRPGYWDNVIHPPSILREGGIYRMWYTGGSLPYLVGYAESVDGIEWSRYEGNPVLTPGSPPEWDSLSTVSTSVIEDGAVHRLAYMGQAGIGSPYQIGQASSIDGLTWLKFPLNPVLPVSQPPAWDSGTVGFASLLREGHVYRMWYGGGTTPRFIGYAENTHMGTGELESQVIDSGAPEMPWVSASWDATTPAGTYVTMAFRTSADGTTWSDWSSESTSSPANLSILTVGRYLQWRASLVSLSGKDTPVLHEVRVGYGRVVAIDIRPGVYPNTIKLKSKSNVPVAILSSNDFDATVLVDRSSLGFGRTGYEPSLVQCLKRGQDVNGDGLQDLLCQFAIQKMGFQMGDTEGVLRGRTITGIPIEGRDSVVMVNR